MKEYTVKMCESGTKFWYLNGELHREDGPAIEWADGSKSWWMNGRCTTEEVMGCSKKYCPNCRCKL